MTRHPDWCDDTDNATALLLLGSGRPPRLDIVCPAERHRIAVVYDAEQLGGLVLVQPAFTALMDHYELGDVVHGPDELFHMHADVRTLNDVDGDEGPQHGRCRCGSWVYRAEAIRAALDRPFGTDPDSEVARTWWLRTCETPAHLVRTGRSAT